jgi:Fic family protein
VIYRIPPVSGALSERLAELSQLREQLGHDIERPARWIGSLRREVRATSIEGSTSIEGFSVTPAEALELTSEPEAADRGEESRQAVACYARAMDRVGTMAVDPSFRWLDRVILDLHFDACHFQRDKGPGLWRTGPVGVTAADGSLEFRGPASDEVEGLMGEVVDWLAEGDLEADPVVRAAMAHLHVVSVHPFRDGNGRVARIVQSLVLARQGLASPEFFSIEEHLGAHTNEYYAALRATQAGSYQPRRDATGWVEFCVEAHISQARQRLAQIKQAAARWSDLERVVEARGWPDRLLIALEQSLIGGTDRRSYCREADVSQATASADFRRLLDASLVKQRGRGRSISYVAADHLRDEVEGPQPAY